MNDLNNEDNLKNEDDLKNEVCQAKHSLSSEVVLKLTLNYL